MFVNVHDALYESLNMIKQLSIICIFVSSLTASEHENKCLQRIKEFYENKMSPLALAIHCGKPQQVRILLKNAVCTEEEIRAALAISREKHTRKITWHLVQRLARVVPLKPQ
jgi:hypothetical protein